MSTLNRLTVFVLWIASLVVVATLASAQNIAVRPEPGPVISGADFGFRPEGWQGNVRTGTFVVRIDGRWIEAKQSGEVV